MSVFKREKLDHLVTKLANNRPVIMLVDDEKSNLDAMSALLEEQFNVIGASSGQLALEQLKAMDAGADLKVIISDYRMPNMNGVEFLNASLSIYPNCMRMILTGYADLEMVIKSINEARIFKFLRKPLSPPELVLNVSRAVEVYDLQFNALETSDINQEIKHLRHSNQRLEHELFEKQQQLHKLTNELNSLRSKTV